MHCFLVLYSICNPAFYSSTHVHMITVFEVSWCSIWMSPSLHFCTSIQSIWITTVNVIMVLNPCNPLHNVTSQAPVLAIHYLFGTLSLKILILLNSYPFYELSQADYSASETIFLNALNTVHGKISFLTFYTSSCPTNLSIIEFITSPLSQCILFTSKPNT